MVLEIREHIKLRGDDPLDATVAGTHYKAYLVANLALNDGPQAAAEHYRIPLATVYGALVFYCDNEAAIDEAIREARELGEQLGARSAQSAIKEMKNASKRLDHGLMLLSSRVRILLVTSAAAMGVARVTHQQHKPVDVVARV